MGFSLKQTDKIKLDANNTTYTITIRRGEVVRLPLFLVLSGNESARYNELQANGRSANDIIKDIFKFEIQGGGTTATVSDIGDLTGALIGSATLIITSKRAVAPQQTTLNATVTVQTDSFFGPDGILTPAIDSVEKYISDAMKTVGGYVGTGAEWAGRQIFSGSAFIQEQLGIDSTKLSDDDKKKLDDRDLEAENDLFAKMIGIPSADLIPPLISGIKIYLAYISAQNAYMEAQIIASIRSIADYDRFPPAKKKRIAKILGTEVSTLENIAKTMRTLRVVPDLIEKLVVGDNPDYGSLLSGLLEHFGAPTLEDLSPDLKCVVNELVVQKLGINFARKEKSINAPINQKEEQGELKFQAIGALNGDMSPENIKYVERIQLDYLILSLLADLKFENITKIPTLKRVLEEVKPGDDPEKPRKEYHIPRPLSEGGGTYGELFNYTLNKQIFFYFGLFRLITEVVAYESGKPLGKYRNPYWKLEDFTDTAGRVFENSKLPSFAEMYPMIFPKGKEFSIKQLHMIFTQSRDQQLYESNGKITGVKRPKGKFYELNITTDLYGSRLAAAKNRDNPENKGPKGLALPNGKPYEPGYIATADHGFIGERNAKNDMIIALSERWDFLVENKIIIADPKNPTWLIPRFNDPLLRNTNKFGMLNSRTSGVATELGEFIDEATDKTDKNAIKEEIAINIQKLLSIRNINNRYTRQNILDIVLGKPVEITQIKPKLDIGLSPLKDLIGIAKDYRLKIVEEAFELGREKGYFSVNPDGKVGYVTLADKLTKDEYESLLKEIEALVIEEDVIVQQLAEIGGNSDPIIRQSADNLELKLSEIQQKLEEKRKLRDEYKEKINIEETIEGNKNKIVSLEEQIKTIQQKIDEINDANSRLRSLKPDEEGNYGVGSPILTAEDVAKAIAKNNKEITELKDKLSKLENEIVSLKEQNKELGYEEPTAPDGSTTTPCLDKYMKMQFMDIFENIDYKTLPQPVRTIVNGVGEYAGLSGADISATYEAISLGKNLYDLGKLGPDKWDELPPENKAWFAKKFGVDEEWAGDAIKFGADISLFAQGKSSGNFVDLLDRGFLRFRDTFLEKFAPGAGSWRDFERLDPKLQSTIAICLGFKPDDKGSHVLKAQRVVRRAVNFEQAIKQAVSIKNSIIAKKEGFDKLGGKGNPEMIDSLTNDLELTPDLISNLYNSTSEITADPYADFMDNIPSLLGGDPGWRQKMNVPPIEKTTPIPHQGKKVTLDIIENPNFTVPATLSEKLKKLVEDKAIISTNNQVTFNADGSVDWNDSVIVTDKALENGKFPIKFNLIRGDFNCSNIKLSTLENSPKIVEGKFDCSNNILTSLQNSPEDVFSFDCSSNPALTSLEGIPKIIRESKPDKTTIKPGHLEVILNFSNCSITSFDPLSTITTFGLGGINCSNNKIKEFYSSGINPTITQVTNFNCSGNQLTSLEKSPVIIKDTFDLYGSYNASNNKIKQLPDGLFTSMKCTDFNISNNEFVDLSFIPVEILGTFDVTGNRGKGFNDGDLGKNRFTPTGRETTTNRRCHIKVLKTDTGEYADRLFPSESETKNPSYQYTSNGQTYTYIWCSGLGRLDQGKARKDAREGYFQKDYNMIFFKAADSSDPTAPDIYIGDDVCPKTT